MNIVPNIFSGSQKRQVKKCFIMIRGPYQVEGLVQNALSSASLSGPVVTKDFALNAIMRQLCCSAVV